MSVTLLPPSAHSLRSFRLALTTAVVRAEGTCTVVVLRGEADFSTTSVVSDVLSWVIAWRSGDVVIDLAELEFIDSATVDALAEGQQLLEHHGRMMTIRSPSGLAARVLNVFGLTDLIEAEGEAQP